MPSPLSWRDPFDALHEILRPHCEGSPLIARSAVVIFRRLSWAAPSSLPTADVRPCRSRFRLLRTSSPVNLSPLDRHPVDNWPVTHTYEIGVTRTHPSKPEANLIRRIPVTPSGWYAIEAPLSGHTGRIGGQAGDPAFSTSPVGFPQHQTTIWAVERRYPPDAAAIAMVRCASLAGDGRGLRLGNYLARF